MASGDIVVQGVQPAPAQGPVGDSGPAGPGGVSSSSTSSVETQAVQLVDSAGQPMDVGGPGLAGPIGAALLGALIAQLIAAWVAHRFRRRDAETSAFEHAYNSGMAARRKASHYVASLGVRGTGDGPRQTFVDALTDFRAAVALYTARDATSPVAVELEAARDVFDDWPSADPSEEEIEDAIYEQIVMESEGNFADGLRISGNSLHEGLDRAVAAFAARSKRPLWGR